MHLGHPQAAMDLGIATIYQELDLVAGLTVAENIYLGHEVSRFGFSQRRAAARSAAALLKRLGHPEISPSQEVGTLSAAGQQIVSMARALSHDVRLIVMDEPSAVLDGGEVKRLFHVIRDLTAEGVAVVYISHRLEEIRTIGDRVTVLKDGRTVATGLPAKETPTAEIIRLMTGRSIEYVFPPRRKVPDAEPLLQRRRPRPAWRVPGRQLQRAARRGPRARRARRRRPLRDPRDRLRCPQERRGHRVGRRRPAAPRLGAGGRLGRCRAGARGAQEPGAAARRQHRDQHQHGQPHPLLARRDDRPRRREAGRHGRRSRASTCAPPGSTARPAPCPAATSRRSCWPAGCSTDAGSSSSTSPPAASTWEPAPRSTPSSVGSPTTGWPSSSCPARSRRCSASSDRVLVVGEGLVLHEAQADQLDEHQVLDIIMRGDAA